MSAHGAGWRRPDARAALALFLLPFVTHGRALLPGRVLSPADHLFAFFPWASLVAEGLPANPVLSDVSLQLQPWLIWGAREIREGRFPLWNPYAFAGAPFFGNLNKGLLFPLTGLTFVLPIPVALTLMSILKLSAAGLAMYWCLRVLSVRVMPAFIAALSFMFNAAIVVWLQYPIASAILTLPLLLGMTELVSRGRGFRRAAALAVAVALAIFAGYPQIAFLGLVITTAWALIRVRDAAGGVSSLGRYATGVGLGVAVAAVQILPFVEYLRDSAIFDNRRDWMPLLHVPPRAAILFLIPHYYGSDPSLRDFWGPFNPAEIAVSVGLVPWVVLPVAILSGWRRPETRFFVVVAGLAGGMLYGVPLLAPAVAALPGMSFIIGFRVASVLIFSLCALCGIGLDAIARGIEGAGRPIEWAVKAAFVALAAGAFLLLLGDYASTRRAGLQVPIHAQYLWFLALLMLAAVSVLAGLRGSRRRWGVALVGVQLAALLPMAVTYNPVLDTRFLYPTTPAIEHLRRESGRDHGRVAVQGNVSMLFGLSEVAGDDGMTPRRIERLVRPGGSISLLGHAPLGIQDVLASPTVDLFGVRRIVVPPGAPISEPWFRLEYDGRDARVYRNERAFPRAFLTWRARCVDDDAGLRLMGAGALDLREEVLLAGCAAPPPLGPRGPASAPDIVRYEPDKVVIRVSTGSPAFLVLTDTWFPGWQARVDGADRMLWRADYAFRAVRVNAGEHEIEFSYEPVSFRVGLWITGLGVCVTGALMLSGRRRRMAGR